MQNPTALSPNAALALERLREIAFQGPLPAIGTGSPAVGMTLLHALGVAYTSSDKPNFSGIVVTARRNLSTLNRVNLFAKVPHWKISPCKSSKEVANRYGYEIEPGIKRLYCSVRARHPNSQGLLLQINRKDMTLDEIATTAEGKEVVARWLLNDLRERLADRHPESIWVEANVLNRNGIEYFHYRKAVYCGPPYVDRFESLLETGTITLDHLIEVRNGSATEKGPLFKISPPNIPLLFPSGNTYDLMAS